MPSTVRRLEGRGNPQFAGFQRSSSVAPQGFQWFLSGSCVWSRIAVDKCPTHGGAPCLSNGWEREERSTCSWGGSGLSACWWSPWSRADLLWSPVSRRARPSGWPSPSTSPMQAPTEPASNVDARPILFVVDPNSGQATSLLSEQGSRSNAEVSPDGRRLVYENREPAVPSQIFVLEPDGTTRQLTNMKREASDPTWSPDGSQIAFVGFRRRDGDRRPDSDIFVMNADGSHIRRLAGTPRPDGHPDWSPDGSRIAFHSRESGGRAPSRRRSDVAGIGRHPHPHPAPRERVPFRSSRPHVVAGRTMDRFQRGRGNHQWEGCSAPRCGSCGRTARTRAWIRKSAIFRVIENPKLVSGRALDRLRRERSARRRCPLGGNGRGCRHPRRARGTASVGSWRDAPSDQPSWGLDGILLSLSRANAVTSPDTIWQPSWAGRPDARVVLTGSGCEQVGDARALDPGVLTIEFANESDRDGVFQGRELHSGQRRSHLGNKVSLGPSTHACGRARGR